MGKHRNRHNHKQQDLKIKPKASRKVDNEPTPSLIDMHVHTVRSLDGGLTVAKVLKHALANNVANLSITDHNNLFAVKKAMRFIDENPEKYKKLNFTLISCKTKEGIEEN